MALLLSSLSAVATKADEIAARRDLQATQALTDISLERVRSITEELASQPPMPAALKGGMSMLPPSIPILTDDRPFDGVFILDDKLRVLEGAFRAQPVDGKNNPLLLASVVAMLDANAGKIERGDAVAGWGNTRYGLAILSVSLLSPPSVGNRGKYLVITRHLTPPYVQDLARSFRMKGLKLTNKAGPKNALALKSPKGDTLGYLTWAPSHPGTEAAYAAVPQIRWGGCRPSQTASQCAKIVVL